MIKKKIINKKAWNFLIAIIITAFVGGFSLGSNLGCVPNNKQGTSTKETPVETTQKEQSYDKES